MIRLLVFIHCYSVDTLFWDQWDYYEAFFSPHSYWEVFSWQHGPHRQGLGNFVIWLVNSASSWNQKVQCIVIGSVVLSAAFVWLLLKKRFSTQLEWFDIIPVLLITSLKQYETYVVTPNISHGALPLLLLIGYAIVLSFQNIYCRHIVGSLINFCLVFTGFGLFAGFSTIGLLLIEGYLSYKRKNIRDGLVIFGSLCAAIATLKLFFTGYEFRPAVDTFVFPDPRWYLYPVFMGIQFGAHLLPKGANSMAGMIVGIIILIIMIIALIITFQSIVKDGTEQDAFKNKMIFLLISFSLLFSLSSAIGRISLGLAAAVTSRYIYLIIPAYIGLFLFGLNHNMIRKQWVWVFITLCAFGVSFPLWQAETCRYFRNGKLMWIGYYRETRSVTLADSFSGFRVHPEPLQTNLDAKLEWLEVRKLSFFGH